MEPPPSPDLTLPATALVLAIAVVLGWAGKWVIARRLFGPELTAGRLFATALIDIVLAGMVFAILLVTGGDRLALLVWGGLVFLVMGGLLNLIALGDAVTRRPWAAVLLPLPSPLAVIGARLLLYGPVVRLLDQLAR